MQRECFSPKQRRFGVVALGSLVGILILSLFQCNQFSRQSTLNDTILLALGENPRIEYLESTNNTLAPGYLIEDPADHETGVFAQFDVSSLHYGDLPPDYWWNPNATRPTVHLRLRFSVERALQPARQSWIQSISDCIHDIRYGPDVEPVAWNVIHVPPPLFYFQPTSSPQLVAEKLTHPNVEVRRAAQELLNSYGLRPLRRSHIGLLLSNLERQLDAAVLENDDGAMALERAIILRDVICSLDRRLYDVGEAFEGFHTREDGVNWLREVRAELQWRE